MTSRDRWLYPAKVTKELKSRRKNRRRARWVSSLIPKRPWPSLRFRLHKQLTTRNNAKSVGVREEKLLAELDQTEALGKNPSKDLSLCFDSITRGLIAYESLESTERNPFNRLSATRSYCLPVQSAEDLFSLVSCQSLSKNDSDCLILQSSVWNMIEKRGARSRFFDYISHIIDYILHR